MCRCLLWGGAKTSAPAERSRSPLDSLKHVCVWVFGGNPRVISMYVFGCSGYNHDFRIMVISMCVFGDSGKSHYRLRVVVCLGVWGLFGVFVCFNYSNDNNDTSSDSTNSSNCSHND